MTLQIKFKMLALFLILFLYSCSSDTQKSEKTEAEKSIVKTADSVQPDSAATDVSKFKEVDKLPKVLTYNEIINKSEGLDKYYEESKEYSSDTFTQKKRLKQTFYNYLTTQLKNMLSTELRILRNEFFARKGYKFKSKDLEEYFSKLYWYDAKIDDASKIELSAAEKEITDTIMVYEEKNKNLDADYLKKQLRDYFKNHLNTEFGENIVEVPSILFRRNIGYRLKGTPQHNKSWFNGEYLNVQLIDTLKNEILLLGLFGQILCPDQFCLYGGELITCDSLLNYIDSESVEFETYSSTKGNNGIMYQFEAPYSAPSDLTIIRIKDNGQIEYENP